MVVEWIPLTLETLLEECIDLHERKDSDYAGDVPYANFMSSTRFGMRPDHAIMVRLSDKYNRVLTLLEKERRGQDPRVAESIDDTLRDLLNYAGIMAVVRNTMCQQETLPGKHEPTLTFRSFVLRPNTSLTMMPPTTLLSWYFAALCEALKHEGKARLSYFPYILSWLVTAAARLILERSIRPHLRELDPYQVLDRRRAFGLDKLR